MINAKLLNDAGIDYEAGLSRFLNDPTLYEAVLTSFAKETLLERAQAAFDGADYALLHNVVHEAKGSSGNAGLDVVYVPASALVSLLRGESYTADELNAAYKSFADAYIAARSSIRAALGM